MSLLSVTLAVNIFWCGLSIDGSCAQNDNGCKADNQTDGVGMVQKKLSLEKIAPGRLLVKTTIKPPWPGKSFQLACPPGTTDVACARLGSAQGLREGCFEPERDTQEVLNSFLLNCPTDSLYIDVGCNIGYFAAHAAALGATVECYEPTPNYITAIKATAELNGLSENIKVHNAAIVADDATHGSELTFNSTYKPCGMAMDDGSSETKEWRVPAISIRHVLSGRHVKLLKIDIDSNEGEIFHTVAGMVMRNEALVDTILVEVGDNGSPMEWHCGNTSCRSPSIHPRGGDVQDFFKLQHQYGYDVYRVNIHVGREIYDWTGSNVNEHMRPQRDGMMPMFSVRSMRKIEKVLPSTDSAHYRELFHAGTSFLITREQLAELQSHHTKDLEFSHLTLQDLNAGNPSY